MYGLRGVNCNLTKAGDGTAVFSGHNSVALLIRSFTLSHSEKLATVCLRSSAAVTASMTCPNALKKTYNFPVGWPGLSARRSKDQFPQEISNVIFLGFLGVRLQTNPM